MPGSVPVIVALLAITAGTLYQKIFCPRFDLASGSIIQFTPSLILTAVVAVRTETMQVACRRHRRMAGPPVDLATAGG